jgi:cytochrome c556
VDENVLAYSNRWGEERSLVIYHNRWGDTRGWLRSSAATLDKGSGQLVRRSLGQGLALSGDAHAYVIFRDLVSGLEYIRNSRDLAENGMYVELGAYQRHVFLDFREVEDNAQGHYGQLAAFLGGRGVPSVEEAVKELYLQPLHQAFRRLVGAETLPFLMDARVLAMPAKGESPWDAERQQRLQRIGQDVTALLDEVRAFATGGEARQAQAQSAGDDEDILLRRLEALALAEPKDTQPASVAEPGQPEPDLDAVAAQISRTLAAVLQLPVLLRRYPARKAKPYRKAAAELLTRLDADPRLWGALFGWVFSARLGQAVSADPAEAASLARGWLDEWLLGKQMMPGLQGLGLGAFEAAQAVTLVKALISHQDWYAASSKKRVAPELRTEKRAYRLLSALLQDPDVQQALGVNRYEDVLWYNREGFDALLAALFAVAAADVSGEPGVKRKRAVKKLQKRAKLLEKLRKADAKAAYEVERLLAALRRKPTKLS